MLPSSWHQHADQRQGCYSNSGDFVDAAAVTVLEFAAAEIGSAAADAAEDPEAGLGVGVCMCAHRAGMGAREERKPAAACLGREYSKKSWLGAAYVRVQMYFMDKQQSAWHPQ